MSDEHEREALQQLTTSECRVLYWICQGLPCKGIAQKLVITWPASDGNYVLESAPSLSPADWTIVTNTPVLLDYQSAVILDASDAKKFFRVRTLP